MDKAERLTLAVRAEVAGIRVGQTRERHAALQRRAAPVYRALQELERRYGENVDPSDHIHEFTALVAQHGGSDIRLRGVMPLMVEMHQAKAGYETAAADAIQELHEAMGQSTTVLQWIGCSVDEYHAAVEATLTP